MKRVLMWSVLTVFVVSIAFAKYDDSYKSWEVKAIKNGYMYVKFRLNIPLVKKYLEKRKVEIKKMIKTAPEERVDMLNRNYTNVLNNLAIINRYKNKKPLKVWVFGDFNNWKTAVSDVPNELIPSKKNPDTWYTKRLVPIKKYKNPKKQYRYKFVIHYGVSKAKDGTEVDDDVYVEDPLSKGNISDDGFGGFNSFFVYPKKK